MRSFFRRFGLGAVVAIITLAGMTLLPHDAYIRWQAERTEAYARLGWIYERIHYDETPIDIAFVGTSHTMNGIDAAAFEQAVDAACVRSDRDNRRLHAVNLAVPSYGRDLHWIIARELLTHRKVKVLVLEVFENETRKASPVFVDVADTADFLGAPMLVNINYMHNLVRLPYRQLSLWAKSLSPASFGLKQHFDPTSYDGSNVDNTRVVNVGGIALSPYRDQAIDPDALAAIGKANLAAKNLHMLGRWADPYEYAVPDYYVTSLLDLAEEKGVDVVFLYLPTYGMPPRPVDDHLYRGRGDWVFANDLLKRPEYWFDGEHLNARGAAEFTRRVASEFVSRWEGSALAMRKDKVTFALDPAASDDLVYPTRSPLKPFRSTRRSGGEGNETP